MNTNPEILEIKNIVQQNRNMLQRHSEILQQHGEILLEVVKEQNYLRGALDQVNKRFGTLDARMKSMENSIVSVENRMIVLEDRLGALEAPRTNTYASLSKDVRDNFNNLSKEIWDNFKWVAILMIPVWFGILAAIAVELVKG